MTLVGHCQCLHQFSVNKHEFSHGTSTKKLTLYAPSKPNIDLETLLWVDGEESDEYGESHQVLSIDQYLAIRDKTKDDEINDFITLSSSSGNTCILEHIMKT